MWSSKLCCQFVLFSILTLSAIFDHQWRNTNFCKPEKRTSYCSAKRLELVVTARILFACSYEHYSRSATTAVRSKRVPQENKHVRRSTKDCLRQGIQHLWQPRIWKLYVPRTVRATSKRERNPNFRNRTAEKVSRIS